MLNITSWPSTDNCPDNSWLGGTPSSLGTGTTIIIGSPIYATANSVTWGVTGNMKLSYGDSTQVVGWGGFFPSTGNNFDGSGL